MATRETDVVGIIPAAGLGARLAPFNYPKELLPIVYDADGGGQLARPRPAMAYSLDQMREAGVRRCFVVVAEWKLEVVRIFGDGEEAGVNLAYVVRNTPWGLADAVATAASWLRDHVVCLALPDTLIRPENALARLQRAHFGTGADVTLGVFRTAHPEQLGPVRFDKFGIVEEVLDKPSHTDLDNTWGLAVWSPRFTALLHEILSGSEPESKPTLGAVFNEAAKNLRVQAHYFEAGDFLDVGTPEGLGKLLLSRPAKAQDSSCPTGTYSSP